MPAENEIRYIKRRKRNKQLIWGCLIPTYTLRTRVVYINARDGITGRQPVGPSAENVIIAKDKSKAYSPINNLFRDIPLSQVKTLMTEQQIDFLKIKQNIGKITPKQLGSLMRQYYDRHLKGSLPPAKNYLDDAVSLFNNEPPIPLTSSK